MSMMRSRAAASLAFLFNVGDWNAFMTLGTDNLAKIVILPAILGTFHLGPEITFGKIMPGLALTLLIGLGTFSFLAVRLAAAQGRPD